MDDVLRVQVPNSKANVYEDLPDYVVLEGPTKHILLHNELIQVAVGTVLKYDIDLLVLYERVIITNNVRRI